MTTVTSKDGTSISYTRRGRGPAVILATGALDDGSENEPLAEALATRFTTYNYARRGRGESGDTPPYAVAREIEDLEALIAEAGGRAHLYGVSSGGALSLEAAAAGAAVDRLALYEVPYFVDAGMSQAWRGYVAELRAALAHGQPGTPLELFHRLAGFSDEDIAAARASPFWAAAQALEHTLAQDAACIGEGEPPTARLATIGAPCLVASGGGTDFIEAAADAIAASMPNAERRTLDGQGHVVEPTVMAPVLEQFFAG
jgi:pimeloyl-ACP methyl ester carboxylesterase